ncbi:29328_t:CDS:2, partial [Racocetra persica]
MCLEKSQLHTQRRMRKEISDLIPSTSYENFDDEKTGHSSHNRQFSREAAGIMIVSSARNPKMWIIGILDFRTTLSTLSTGINGLTQVMNEQNQNEFVTSIQRISNEHGIKIQRIEDTLMTATTVLENLSTTNSVLQTNMNSLLPYIQNRRDTIINISNTTNHSPRAITTANPILTAKIHDKMRYFNGFDDFEPPLLNNNYVYDFELGPKNRKNKRITQNYVELFIKEFDVQFEETQTNEKWNENTITEITEAYFKTLKKERNTTLAAKLLNDQRAPALNKIPENQLNHPKSEIKKLFSFEATSPEVSDAEEMPIAIPFGEQDHISELSRKKLLVPFLPWISDEGIRIRNIADEEIKRTRIE